jgi:hypothetical protein
MRRAKETTLLRRESSLSERRYGKVSDFDVQFPVGFQKRKKKIRFISNDQRHRQIQLAID